MELVYWLILFSWVAVIWFSKKTSNFAFYPAFVLFIIAAVLTVFGLRSLAEPIMRISFIGWLIGIFKALMEYKKSNRLS